MGRAKKNVEVEAQVIARGNVVPMMTETESEETVQYVSDEDAAREDRLVSEIRMITEQTKQVVLFNSIEIGRRLTEAKAMVKRGTWGTWLKERVDYSQRTANNFMKIYQEYGRNGLAEKSQALANLSYTQALALIDLPEDERARFAEERKAGEMALRKLQEEVRQEKEKVTAVKELANRNAAEAEAKFAIESALDAYSRAADTVIEVGRLDKVEASKLLDDMAESSQSIVAKFVKTLKSE